MRKILLLFANIIWCQSIFGQTPTIIKTPTNNAINAFVRSEMSYIDSIALEADVASWLSAHSSSAVRVGPPTATYNCHNYAWHKKDGGECSMD